MKIRKAVQRLITALIVGLMTAVTVQAAVTMDPADSPQDITALRQRMVTLMKDNKVPGVSYAVFNADGVQFADALGESVVENKQALKPDTRLRIGSVTKVFTALLTLRAIDDGKFTLNTPVKDILPEVPIINPYERSEPVRVVHLLEHTAGIDDMQLGSIYRAEESREPMLRAAEHDANSLKVRWQPGTEHAYSNTGYTVLAALLEKTYAKSWETLVQEQVLTPLNMRETLMSNEEAMQVEHANGYTGDKQSNVGMPALWHRAAGAIWTTPNDLAELGRFLMTEGASHPGVIHAELLREMRRVHTTTAAMKGLQWGYGLGLYQAQVNGLPLFGHNGAVDGFAANLYFSPEYGMGFAEIHNSDNTVSKFARALSGYLQMKNQQTLVPHDADVFLSNDEASPLNGWYRISNTRNGLSRGADYLMGIQYLDWRDQQLQLEPLAGEPQKFVYLGHDRWRDSERKRADSIMLRDAQNNIIAFDTDGSYLERISTVSALAPLVAIALALLALISAPFGRRRAMNNPWPRRWNALALLSLVLIVGGIALLDGIASAATISRGPVLIFAGTLLLPLTAIAGLVAIAFAWRNENASIAKWRCAAGAVGATTISVYFACFHWLGLGLWWH